MMVRHGHPTWIPSSDDYVDVLVEQNPWWSTAAVPEALAREVERPLGTHLRSRVRSNEPRRFQIVLGPRRVGKTTCLYQTVRHMIKEGIPPSEIWWLRLDHPLLMDIPLDALMRVVLRNRSKDSKLPRFVFLDEVTYSNKWDSWLKTFYDEQWPVSIAGSSSSTAVLKDRRMESGIGRWDEQYLAPYLFPEFLDLLHKPVELPVKATLAHTIDSSLVCNEPLADLSAMRRMFIVTGGFPELLLSYVRGHESDTDEQSLLLQSQRTLRSDAVERAIYKDIPQAFGVDNPMILERLLYTLAGQVTGILSPASICRSISSLSQPTFDRYLSYLCQAFLLFTLPNYSGTEETRQRRGRKLYFVDGAVRNAALQRGIRPLNDPGEMGLLLENLVAGHLHALCQQSEVRLYHWREGQDEVDLIYDHPTEPIAFEISLSAGHSRRALSRFVEKHPRFSNRSFLVAPTAPATRPEDNRSGIGTLPVDLLLVAIGRQAQYHLKQRLC